MVSCFLHHSKRHLIFLHSHDIFNSFQLTRSFASSLMLINISKMSKLLSSSIMYVNKETFNLRQLMQMMIRLQEHKKQEFLIVFFNYDHRMLMTNKIKNQYQIIEFFRI